MTVDTEEEWHWDTGWPTRNLAVTNIRNLPKFQKLCSRHGVIRVPTTALFVGGRIEDQIFGHTSVENISSMITPFLL